MSVNVAAGTANLKTAGVIPDLYADEFNVEYYDKSLISKTTTGKFYEGLLESGDKVTIPQLPDITWNSYEKNGKLTTETPQGTNITMPVDRAQYFSTRIDDVDLKQSAIDLVDKYKMHAVENWQSIVCEEYFADIYNQAHASNQGATAGVKSGAYNLGVAGSPLSITAATVQAALTMTRAVLEEQSAGSGKLWIAIPTWMRYLVINSDLMKINEMGGTKSGMISGFIGSIDGMEMYSTNTLKTTTADQSTGTYIMGGNMDAISYISQLNKCEILTKTQDYFGSTLRGLNVYDWKVRKPEGLVSIYGYKGS